MWIHCKQYRWWSNANLLFSVWDPGIHNPTLRNSEFQELTTIATLHSVHHMSNRSISAAHTYAWKSSTVGILAPWCRPLGTKCIVLMAQSWSCCATVKSPPAAIYKSYNMTKKWQYKNSSGDEIANVNSLRRNRTRTSKYQKIEPISFSKINDK